MGVLRQEQMVCGICANFKINATLVDCGHDFCEACLYQWLGLSGKCLSCDTPVKCFYKNYLLDSTIKTFLSQ